MNQLPNYRKKREEKTPADIHNNKGVDFCVQGKFDEGIAEFYKALRDNPNFPIAHFNRGLSFLNLRLEKSAIVDFETAFLLKRNFDELFAQAEFDEDLIEFIESTFGISTR
ncbi:hypothetical protein C6501_19320 [Candidatus Poribacteria bacterium]|nr:MAG: hypothetical protein C6501_19320 [Candidatus Poribacteria bacterium]